MSKRSDPYPTFTEYKSERWERLVAARPTAYHAYRQKWEDNPRGYRVEPFPLCLDIETTNYCNLRCTMCFRTLAIAQGTFHRLEHMEWSLYTRLLDEGAAYGLPSVKLNYYGEPLMDPQMVARVQYAKKSGVLDVSINTNATLLTEGRARALLDAGIDGVYFSVDGYSAETFNAIRVGASFATVRQHIERFIALRDAGGYNVLTRVNFVRMPENAHEWPAFVEFWSALVDAVGVADAKVYDTTLATAIVPDFVCAQPFQRLFIAPNGVVTPCCEDAMRQYVLGDTHTDALYDLWHGEKLTQLRQKHLSGCYHHIDLCRNCTLPHMT